MAGFVENVNKVAQELSGALVADVTSVADSLADVSTVATSIDEVVLVADNMSAVVAIGPLAPTLGTVVTNIVEILAADDNAIIATAQAGIATTQATAAEGSATSAGLSATSASTSAITASTAASTATTKATEANTSATSASASASAAASSATSANTSAIAAALSATEAATLLDMFDDRYLGVKNLDPLVDNDGNPLLVGALYFNSVSNQMRVWDGVAWTDSLTLTAGSVSVLTNKTIDAMTNTVGADHVHYKCRNVSGSTIAKGAVVAAQGTQSGTDYIEIVPVTDPQTQIALGVAHVSIANNGTGLVLNTGVEEDRDTSAWAVGTILYPNTTGGFTSTKPTTGRYQACAVVLRQHSNHGTLLCEFTEPKYIASTAQAGYVQLNNTLTSTSSTQALTAAQGKILNDRLTTVENGTVQEGDSVTLTGDVTGTAVFDANGNVSITTMVVDDSHNHVISNVDGLQTALDGKQPLDTTLTALAGVATSADKYIYATGADVFTTGTITSFGRSLVDDADATTARGTLGISATNTPSTAVGTLAATNVQSALQELDTEKVPLNNDFTLDLGGI